MQTNVIRRNIQRSLIACCYLIFPTLSPRSSQQCELLWCFSLIHYLCGLLTRVSRAITWSNICPMPYHWETCVRVCALWNNPRRYINSRDGSENVGKIMNLRSFKLNRVCLDPLNMSNAGDFSWSWILKDLIQVQKRGRKIRRPMSKSSIKRQIRRFHVVVVQWMSKKCTKKRDAHAELLFWSLNLLFFKVVVVVIVVVPLLKLPILRWLRGLLVVFLYLVWFSLRLSLTRELRGNRVVKDLQFCPLRLGVIFEF